MPIVRLEELQRSVFHGCIVPRMAEGHRARFSQVDHAFLRDELWRRAPAPTFLKPSFFAVPDLGPRRRVRDLVLFGEEFLALEERLEAFLVELEGVLRELRWSRVHASFHGWRSGTFTFTWRAIAPSGVDDGPTQAWQFEGPRTIPLLHDGLGRPMV